MPEANDSAPVRFPFSGVVGQEPLKLALILNAVDPGIGGVVIRGDKGTAKTTAVRALGAILSAVARESGEPESARVVELPIGATEDRVIGSVDISAMLASGHQRFTPGVLADANGGVLYIDEVNLLADHLVDVLLDAAATGRAVVERDGISHSYPARFVLVGTMNPEEGELRPQLLDRFGLSVDVSAPVDVDARVQVIERRLAYDTDPDKFCAYFADADHLVAQRIAAARRNVRSVALPSAELRRIAGVCASLDVDGLRGDIVVARTARAHAAWRQAECVQESDIRVAVELALAHRRRRDAFDEPGLSDGEIEEAMSAGAAAVDTEPDPDPDGSPGRQPGSSEEHGQSPPPGSGESPPPGSGESPPPGTGQSPPPGTGQSPPPGTGQSPPPGGDTPSAPAPSGTVTLGSQRQKMTTTLTANGIGDGDPGRRSQARSRRGRVIRAGRSGHRIHILASARAATERQIMAKSPMPVRFSVNDLRPAIMRATESNLVVFCVDVSGSMAARRRLEAVTQACVALLRDSYQRRDQVAVIAMRGTDATLVVPPTRSVQVALHRLDGQPTGGRTPLAEGLIRSWEVIAQARRRDRDRRALLVILTDGRATAGPDPMTRAQTSARELRARHRDTVVIDCEDGMIRLGMARALAVTLGARTLTLNEFTGTPDAGRRAIASAA